MSPIIKEHLVSGLQTFITTFLVVLGTTLAQGDILWSSAFWGAVTLVAARAAIKEVFAQFAPIALGGRK